MVFNSYEFFILLLPVFLVGFFMLRDKSAHGAKWWIVLMSVLFYGPFGARNCAVLAASIVVNAVLANAMARKYQVERGSSDASGEKEKSDSKQHSGISAAILILALVANVAVLLFFKFGGVFFPIAISFYTFNQISYLVDLYRGEIEEFNLLDYLCYILFFPKILQGPLMGYGDFCRELEKAVGIEKVADMATNAGRPADVRTETQKRRGCVDFEIVLRGLLLFSMGLFKKVIMADTFGKAVDYGFGNIQGLGSLEAILVAVFYSFQLYFDFSGYCDMAAAICMIIGFELPLNFDSPYKAVNIVDFWKRWHITLTKFFTKYVYIPLGGNRKGAARMYSNFMIVFLLSGLWHGSGWTFIIWGAMHGLLYVVTRAMKEFGKENKNALEQSSRNSAKNILEDDADGNSAGKVSVMGKLIHVGKVGLTFIYVTLAWVFFRSNTPGDAITLIKRFFTGGHRRINTHLSSCFQLDELWYFIKVTPIMKLSFAWDVCLWLFLIVAAVMIFFAPTAITISKKCKIGVKTTLLIALLLVWSIISFACVSTFLYMNF